MICKRLLILVAKLVKVLRLLWRALTPFSLFTDNQSVKQNRILLTVLVLLFLVVLAPISAQDVLRGEVKIELEPIYGGFVEDEYPLQTETIYRRALELAAMFFSAQIYGWSFYYDIGERARGIAEEFELSPLGEIQWGDPRLNVTHANLHNFVFSAWMDYRPSEMQKMRIDMWRTGSIRSAQAHGFGPLGSPVEPTDWLTIRKTALEDAARAAVRAMLQGSERNRPKEATGFISLQNFPAFWMDRGRWAASARFRVDIREVIPFAAH